MPAWRSTSVLLPVQFKTCLLCLVVWLKRKWHFVLLFLLSFCLFQICGICFDNSTEQSVEITGKYVYLLNLGNTFSVSGWSQIIFVYHSVGLIHINYTWVKICILWLKTCSFIGRWGFLFYERLWWCLNATDDLQYCYSCNVLGIPTNKKKEWRNVCAIL